MAIEIKPDEKLLNKVIALCEEAGSAILKVYNQERALNVETKADDSPVTEADLAAHRVLVRDLPGFIEGVPLLSEEGKLPDWEVRREWNTYWIIDPLDGTKEFISRNGEFTVNVALVLNGEPILGVVYVPVTAVTYCGIKGVGAWKISAGVKQVITSRSIKRVLDDAEKFVLVASRRHGADAVDSLIASLENIFGEVDTRNMGSSLKLCLVAEGQADLYPRLALTSEWDTAAAQAVVEAAGGHVYKEDLSVLRYNTKKDILNPWFYVVGDPSFAWSQVLRPFQSSPK